jgi:hypothetical protein
MNSIKKINGVKTRGVPGGKKIWKKFNLCKIIPIILIPIKAVKERNNVTTKELVTVNEKGIKPIKFPHKMKKNKKEKKGRKRLELPLIFSLITVFISIKSLLINQFKKEI